MNATEYTDMPNFTNTSSFVNTSELSNRLSVTDNTQDIPSAPDIINTPRLTSVSGIQKIPEYTSTPGFTNAPGCTNTPSISDASDFINTTGFTNYTQRPIDAAGPINISSFANNTAGFTNTPNAMTTSGFTENNYSTPVAARHEVNNLPIQASNLRHCYSCGGWKEWKRFPKRDGKSTSSRDYSNDCYSCIDNMEETSAGKICRLCKRWKPVDQFISRKKTRGQGSIVSSCEDCRKSKWKPQN